MLQPVNVHAMDHTFRRIAAFFPALAVSASANAQTYPARPSRLVVPLATSGNVSAEIVTKSPIDSTVES